MCWNLAELEGASIPLQFLYMSSTSIVPYTMDQGIPRDSILLLEAQACMLEASHSRVFTTRDVTERFPTTSHANSIRSSHNLGTCCVQRPQHQNPADWMWVALYKRVLVKESLYKQYSERDPNCNYINPKPKPLYKPHPGTMILCMLALACPRTCEPRHRSLRDQGTVGFRGSGFRDYRV